MFFYAEDFNQDISNWDVSNVTNMRGMFEIARSFKQDISNWDVSSVTTMKGMFPYTDFNHDISDWDVSNVVDMKYMFYSADNFNHDFQIGMFQMLLIWNICFFLPIVSIKTYQVGMSQV